MEHSDLNRKVNWGVLGTANIARKHTIPGMQEAENCHLYAVAGRSLEKAEAFRDSFGFEKAYGSYEALLADPAVEAVYIPLPNELHYEWTVKAMEAVKHVLCEKPLAPTPDQVRALAQVADEQGVYLMEAFACLHSPLLAAVKAELDVGTIGTPLYMESAFLTSDYDISNIRMRRETYGGALYDLGCYRTSQILWLLGGEPDRVQAVAEFSDRGIDTLTSAMLHFPDGKKATLTCGMCLATEKGDRIDRFRIHGTAGSIRCDARFNQSGNLTYTVHTAAGDEEKTVPTPDNYRLEVEQLGRCIRLGEAPWVSAAFSQANSRLMDTILRRIGY